MGKYLRFKLVVFIVIYTLLVLSMKVQAQRNWFVATDGNPSGDGTIGNPYDIATMFDNDLSIKPSAGDTVFFRGGTYVNKFSIWFRGAEGQNVIVQNYNSEKVVIDGNDGVDSHRIILVNNDYITIKGLEIKHSGLSRVTTDTSLFPDYPYHVHGIFINSIATNFEIYNCIIHDTHGNAVASYGPNTKIIGNIFYYNGWDNPARGSAYGFYMQNTDTTTFGIATHNIIFSNFSKALHVYGESTPLLTNISINDNICFNPGAPSWEANGESGTEGSIFVGALCPVKDIEIKDNHCYNTSNTSGEPIRVGYWDEDNHDITLTGNYAIGGLRSLQVMYSRNVYARDNFVYNRNRVLTRLTGDGQESVAYDTYDWDNNTYYFNGSYDKYAFDSKSWNDWNAHGLDKNGAYYKTAPTDNEYHIKYTDGMKWANLVIYDWEMKGAVAVDLSSVIETNSDYSIYDVQNLEGDPVLTDTYSGGLVSVPTKLTTITPIIGIDVASPIVHTDQEFNVYIVVPRDIKKCSVEIDSISQSSMVEKFEVYYKVEQIDELFYDVKSKEDNSIVVEGKVIPEIGKNVLELNLLNEAEGSYIVTINNGSCADSSTITKEEQIRFLKETYGATNDSILIEFFSFYTESVIVEVENTDKERVYNVKVEVKKGFDNKHWISLKGNDIGKYNVTVSSTITDYKSKLYEVELYPIWDDIKIEARNSDLEKVILWIKPMSHPTIKLNVFRDDQEVSLYSKLIDTTDKIVYKDGFFKYEYYWANQKRGIYSFKIVSGNSQSTDIRGKF